jgi:[CysO sulfur-carrier protein]-S-L-cysteine hydrolase
MRDAIFEHARAEAPRECCGVIESRDGELVELHRLTNTYPGVDFYEPEAGELYRLLVALDDRAGEVAVIYHSHPVSVAYPSARDVEFAGWPDSVYLICSLADPAAPVLRAFHIVDEQITEVSVRELAQ